MPLAHRARRRLVADQVVCGQVRGHPREARRQVVGAREGAARGLRDLRGPAESEQVLLDAHRGQVAGGRGGRAVDTEARRPGQAARRREVDGRVAALRGVDHRSIARLSMFSSRGEPLLRTRMDFRPGEGAMLRASLSSVSRSTSRRRRVASSTRCADESRGRLARRHGVLASVEDAERAEVRVEIALGPTRPRTVALWPARTGPCPVGGPTATGERSATLSPMPRSETRPR